MRCLTDMSSSSHALWLMHLTDIWSDWSIFWLMSNLTIICFDWACIPTKVWCDCRVFRQTYVVIAVYSDRRVFFTDVYQCILIDECSDKCMLWFLSNLDVIWLTLFWEKYVVVAEYWRIFWLIYVLCDECSDWRVFWLKNVLNDVCSDRCMLYCWVYWLTYVLFDMYFDRCTFWLLSILTEACFAWRVFWLVLTDLYFDKVCLKWKAQFWKLCN